MTALAQAVIGRLDSPIEKLGGVAKRLVQMVRPTLSYDEFQQIRNYPEKGVEALLRSQIQFSPAQFIFAGSKQHLMRDMFTSLKMPFYQSTTMMPLGVIEEQAYYDFASGFFASVRRLLKAVARERIVTEPQSGEFITRYGLRAASSVKTSLEMLLEKQLLYRDDRGYVVYDRLLGEWLRRQ